MYFYEFMFCVLCMYILAHYQKISIYRKGVTMNLSNCRHRTQKGMWQWFIKCVSNISRLTNWIWRNLAWFGYVRLFSYKLTVEVMRLRNGKVFGSSHLGDDFYRYMLWKWRSKYLFDLMILSLTCSRSCSGHFENKKDQSFYKEGK